MKAVVIHNHIVINIPRKGKQIEPNKEQMLNLARRQISRVEKELETWRKILLNLETSSSEASTNVG